MKKIIIEAQTKKEVIFSPANLPMMIHGVEGSGASFFSMIAVAELHKRGTKLLIYTAYPMAKDEFMSQIIDVHNMFYLEDSKDILRALEFQTIFIQSGNTELFKKIISKNTASDRIIFIKNIDIIRSSLYKLVTPYKFIVSGDLNKIRKNQEFKNMEYNTKILFTPLDDGELPLLEKYQAYMKNSTGEKIVIITEE